MRNLVQQIVEATLFALKAQGHLKGDAHTGFGVDPPKNAAHGDWSSNVAMVLAKGEGEPPRKLAERIKAALVDPQGAIKSCEIAGPGFLNFTIADAVVQRVAREVVQAGARFGTTPERSTGQKVIVEFVSANPTGPVHLGHARGAFVGDAIARLLHAAGHDVTREFYINDFGKQVETLGRTVHKRYRQLFGEQVELVEGEYPAEYVVEIAKVLRTEVQDKLLGVAESTWLKPCIDIAIRENLAKIKATLDKAHIRFDSFKSEADLHAAGKVTGVVDHYRKLGATYDADVARGTEDKVRRDESKAAHFADKQLGGTFLKTSEDGDDEDRIILRKDGTPVYLTADLAYHKDKVDRGFHRIIDVFGADHAGHVPRIRAGVTLLGVDPKRLDFVLVQIVKITRDGEEVKISKRKGTVFELDDLLDEVGPDPCRFTFLMKTANAQFEFDLSAVTAQSSDNPVFYFQYGHARCAQVLKKAGEQGVAFNAAVALTDATLAHLVLPEERALLIKMSQLPDVVAAAAAALEPHKVLYFCRELIAEFHSYYSKYKKTERVVSDDVHKTQARLALVTALKTTLKNAFLILGVDAPEHMSLSHGTDDDDDAAAHFAEVKTA